MFRTPAQIPHQRTSLEGVSVLQPRSQRFTQRGAPAISRLRARRNLRSAPSVQRHVSFDQANFINAPRQAIISPTCDVNVTGVERDVERRFYTRIYREDCRIIELQS